MPTGCSHHEDSMTESKDNPATPSTSEITQELRAYSPPEITFFEPLEAFAATCSGPTAKADPVACSLGPISS